MFELLRFGCIFFFSTDCSKAVPQDLLQVFFVCISVITYVMFAKCQYLFLISPSFASLLLHFLGIFTYILVYLHIAPDKRGYPKNYNFLTENILWVVFRSASVRHF